MRKFVLALLGGASLALPGTGPALATPIDNPDAAYLGATGMCIIDGAELSMTSTCTDATGAQVNFTPAGQVRQVPTSWRSWSSTPWSESPTPKVVFFSGTMATLDYGTDALDSSVLGSEWQPNSFNMFTIACSFQSGGAEIERVSRLVTGQAGARLFAVDLDLDAADTIVCSIPAEAQGFATAHIRGDALTSAPASAGTPDEVGASVNNGGFFTNAG
jgi:hypothetical protein